MMARKEIVLRVFIAAPDDVCDEVSVVEASIVELNRTLPAITGIRLEMVNWRTDTVPGIGVDAQGVINGQVGDPDIFIGLLWGRFGQPTLRAGSGTEEEFNRAHARWCNSSASIRLMMYFKKAPLDFDQICPPQIEAIRAFKARISAQGVLYHEFIERDEFANFVRVHLTKQVHEYGRTWGEGDSTGELTTHVQTMPEHVVDDEGIIELNERGMEGFLTMTEAIGRVNRLLDQIGERVTDRTAEVQLISSLPENERMRASKQVFNGAATDLAQFARGLVDETTLLSDSMASGVEAFSKALTYTEFYRGEEAANLNTLGEALHALPLAILRSQESMASVK